MAGRGGARPGAGRKRGSVNKLSAAAAAAARRTGKLPHELLLMVAQGKALPGDKVKPTRAERIDAAKAAAPYYAPRLLAAAVKTNPGDDNPWFQLMKTVSGESRGLPAEVAKRRAAG